MSDLSDQIAPLNAVLEGRYRVEREIGGGGMATVYSAEDLRYGRRIIQWRYAAPRGRLGLGGGA